MIYLDHNATTPLDERVLEAMMPYLREQFGNPSSVHAAGRAARAALDVAREQVAQLAGAHPSQVIFTSGGTEANNMAIKGVAGRLAPATLAISAVEHPSVLKPARAMAAQGWVVRELAVDVAGRVEPAALEEALKDGARLVSVMQANNETGTLNDIALLAEMVRRYGAVLHSDAVQAAGKLPLEFTECGTQLLSLSAHKLGGPKGVGALVAEKQVALEPLLHGGGQERGYRSGTENLAAIVGFGKAAELAVSEGASRSEHMLALRERFEQGLKSTLPESVIFAEQAARLPNTVFFALPGIDGETLAVQLDAQSVALSSGSACGSVHSEPSHVLKAMGMAADVARGAVRVSLGTETSEQDIDRTVAILGAVVKQLQSLATTAWA